MYIRNCLLLTKPSLFKMLFLDPVFYVNHL